MKLSLSEKFAHAAGTVATTINMLTGNMTGPQVSYAVGQNAARWAQSKLGR